MGRNIPLGIFPSEYGYNFILLSQVLLPHCGPFPQYSCACCYLPHGWSAKGSKNLFNSRFMVKLSVPDPKNILDFFSETTNQHFINACPDAHRLFLPGNWKILFGLSKIAFIWYVFTETYPGIFNSLWKFLACVTDPL